MHILIIGGTRYMGRIAVQRLLERSDTVTVFSRGNTKPEWWSQVHHIAGNRSEYKDFRAKLKGKPFDAVIDMQAYRKEDIESALETFRGNIGRYVMISTGSVYLDSKLDFAT
ncbi:MAG: NAD-dependent epimerase/dehydratase family protein, partial [Candidatus Tectomicrobia bacterium]|nr:NAD-dependent epimerase/dehydratase family protein [Candidatus Tectomicrobia bacterium]